MSRSATLVHLVPSGIGFALLVSAVLLVSTAAVPAEGAGAVDKLLAHHERALAALEEKAGMASLEKRYLGHLEKLAGETPDAKLRALVMAEAQAVRSPGGVPRGGETFPQLERLQTIYDTTAKAIRERTAAGRSTLTSTLRAELRQLAERSAGDEKQQALAALRALDGGTGIAGEQAAPPPHPPEGARSPISFRILQEQPRTQGPTLAVPDIRSREELDKFVSTGGAKQNPAAAVVGTTLPPDVGSLDAPRLSRTLLIYSGEGDQREAIGSLLLRGSAALEPSRPKDEDPASGPVFRLPGDKDRVPTMVDGEIILLEKRKDPRRTFEIKAGPATISVRGTKVYLIPKGGDVTTDPDAGKRSKAQEVSLLVTEGTVDVSGTARGGADRRQIEVGDKGMLSMSSLARVASFFEHTAYADAYNDNLRYYPTSSSWLLADFEAANITGPLVLPGLSEEDTGSGPFVWGHAGPGKHLVVRGGAILSFPPIDTGYYRYLTFDCQLSNLSKSPPDLLVFWGAAEPHDCRALHYSIPLTGLPEHPTRTRSWKRVTIDLWGADGSLHGKLAPAATTLAFSSDLNTRQRVGVDNIELWPEDKAPDLKPLALKTVHTIPIRQSFRDGEKYPSYPPVSEIQQYLSGLDVSLQGGLKKLLISAHHGNGSLKLTSGEMLPNCYRQVHTTMIPKDDYKSGSWAVLPSRGGGVLKLDPRAIMLACKSAIAAGVEEIVIELDLPDLEKIAGTVADFGKPGDSLSLTPGEIAEKLGSSSEAIEAVRTGLGNRRKRERDKVLAVLPKLHRAALEKILAYANPENRPVAIHSILLEASTTASRIIDLEILHADRAGAITREAIHPGLE